MKSVCIGNLMKLVKLMKNLANCCNLPNLSKFFTANVFYCTIHKCKYTEYYNKLWPGLWKQGISGHKIWNFNFFIKYRYATETIWLTIYLECTWSLQNFSVVNTEQEKFHSVNVHILCRYAQFLQAQSNTCRWTEFWGYCFVKMVFSHQAKH